MTNPTAAALIIGNELLSGRTADANLNVIARRLSDVGVHLQEARFVRDDDAEIVETLNQLREKYTYVFTTGGIGPTHDDITAACVAKAFGVSLVRDDDTVRMLKGRGKPTTEATFKMADFPEGAELIRLPDGIPPAFYIGNVFALAGIPNVMRMMLEGAIPLLQQGEEIHTLSVDALVPENKISASFGVVQEQFPDVELGSYPFKTADKYGTSLVVRGTNRKKVETAFGQVQKFLQEIEAPTR
ncbi:MAG: competence/damage-inducible protein A [Alphaproteobacteria bacterium]|nr:competence/damage-inducible protein A [Alphaproteobacteria bacterium]MDD9919262.1 competence/damage-inducible protein A [Alphaproteobacteria bacterium]